MMGGGGAQLLLFVTGSPRVPLTSVGPYSILFLRGADATRLPVRLVKCRFACVPPASPVALLRQTASTCFNALTLPAYESKDVLAHNLLLAISETEGFNLV